VQSLLGLGPGLSAGTVLPMAQLCWAVFTLGQNWKMPFWC
jgi:hypothetical protein